jgi:hypothetical protein
MDAKTAVDYGLVDQVLEAQGDQTHLIERLKPEPYEAGCHEPYPAL